MGNKVVGKIKAANRLALKYKFSPRTLRKKYPCWHLNFSPVIPVSDFWLTDYAFLFKEHQICDNFITAANRILKQK